jgi:hypothetical protein
MNMPKWLCLLLFVVKAVHAQPQSTTNFNQHSLDPLLINGKIYDFQKPSQAIGSQYFVEYGFVSGSVVIDTVAFDGVLLNYDVFNQQLVIQFTNTAGGTSLLTESQAWLKCFVLEGRLFNLLMQNDSSKRIYQVLGTGKFQLLFYYSKELRLDNPSSASKIYAFSPLKRNSYIKTGDKILAYRTNKGFLAAFDKTLQPKIKAYLKEHHIKVRKADDPILEALIDYCNTLQHDD